MTRQQRTTLAIALAVVGGLFVLCLGGLGVLVLASRVPSRPTASDQKSAVIQPAGGKEGDSRKVYTREEFKKLVMGKTPEEVIAAVGRPWIAEDNDDGSPRWWSYLGRALNPATGEAGSVEVYFQDGKVARVKW